jgi:uncharacterized protein YkwD
MGSRALGEPSPRQRTCRALALVCAAVALAAPGVEAASGEADRGARASRVEHSVIGCTNQERARYGLPPLRPNPVLRHAAEYHARNMLRYRFFSHHDVFGHGPPGRVSLFGNLHRYRWLGENLATGFTSGWDACRGWMASAHHRANVLSRHFTLIGVGFAAGGGSSYFVEDFGSYRGR